MDVGGTVPDGLQQQGVDQAHDRRVVAAVQQVVDGGRVLGQGGEIVLGRGIVGGGGGLAAGLLAQDRVEAVVVDRLEGYVAAVDTTDFQQGLKRRRAAVQADRAVAAPS